MSAGCASSCGHSTDQCQLRRCPLLLQSSFVKTAPPQALQSQLYICLSPPWRAPGQARDRQPRRHSRARCILRISERGQELSILAQAADALHFRLGSGRGCHPGRVAPGRVRPTQRAEIPLQDTHHRHILVDGEGCCHSFGPPAECHATGKAGHAQCTRTFQSKLA